MGFPYMLVGYMRVSTDNDRQVLDLQRDALLSAGVDERQLFDDHVSGGQGDRPGLAKALAFLRPGDCLVVWKLDRLGRSLPHLLATVNDLKSRGVALLHGCSGVRIASCNEDHATRTQTGRPSSIMRLSTLIAILISHSRRASPRERNASPITRL